MLAETIEAVVLAGFPMFLITYGLYQWSLKKDIIPPDPENSDLRQRLKKVRTNNKKKKIKTGSMFHDKWFSFGGGFYGLMAFLTYLVIEGGEVIDFIQNFNGILDFIERINVSMIVNFFIESIKNFVAAMVWFLYWGDAIDTNRPFLWLGVTYLGYYLGIHRAAKVSAIKGLG